MRSNTCQSFGRPSKNKTQAICISLTRTLRARSWTTCARPTPNSSATTSSTNLNPLETSSRVPRVQRRPTGPLIKLTTQALAKSFPQMAKGFTVSFPMRWPFTLRLTSFTQWASLTFTLTSWKSLYKCRALCSWRGGRPSFWPTCWSWKMPFKMA